jgi:hypothetical protein
MWRLLSAAVTCTDNDTALVTVTLQMKLATFRERTIALFPDDVYLRAIKHEGP